MSKELDAAFEEIATLSLKLTQICKDESYGPFSAMVSLLVAYEVVNRVSDCEFEKSAPNAARDYIAIVEGREPPSMNEDGAFKGKPS